MASAAASAMMSFMLLLLFSLTASFTGRLFSLEHGLALLHEGSACFDVVLALEAGFDQRGARLGVEGRAPLKQLAHDARTSDSSSATGATRCTKPIVFASSALNWRPVMSTSRANAGPTMSTRF